MGHNAFIAAKAEYDKLPACSINMQRGLPSLEQLALADRIMTIPVHTTVDGVDIRNYGCPDGLPSVRHLGGKMFGVKDEYVLALGNSSLRIMASICTEARINALPGADTTWNKENIFLCCEEGYDRHFDISNRYYTNVAVPLRNDGPDLGIVAQHLQNPKVVGMWCVPVFSNPTGITYTDRVVQTLAELPAANPQFRIFWDNAYGRHPIHGKPPALRNIFDACAAAGHPDRVFGFMSTSKMAHPGSGVAFVAASHTNLAWIRSWLSIHEINPDKVNQARVGEFFKSLHELDVHMHKHAEILFPKFRRLTTELRNRCHDIEGFATSDPDGGYFVPLWVPAGTARRTVDLCKEKGLLLTAAGSTHVGKVNALDNFIRLAPTYLSVHDISTAAVIIATAIRYASEELVDIKGWADA